MNKRTKIYIYEAARQKLILPTEKFVNENRKKYANDV